MGDNLQNLICLSGLLGYSSYGFVLTLDSQEKLNLTNISKNNEYLNKKNIYLRTKLTHLWARVFRGNIYRYKTRCAALRDKMIIF